MCVHAGNQANVNGLGRNVSSHALKFFNFLFMFKCHKRQRLLTRLWLESENRVFYLIRLDTFPVLCCLNISFAAES